MSGGQGGWRVFWERVEGALSNMARWFEGLVDRLQSSGSVAGALGLLVPSSMDTLNTLLVAWLVFGLLVVVLGYVFYVKVIKSGSKGNKPKSVLKASDESADVKSEAKELTGPVVEPCRDPTIVPAKPIHDEVPIPVATGADPDAVLWTNTVFKWLFSKPDGANAVREAWLNTINEFTHRSAIESGVLLEVVQVYDVTPPPTLRNVVVDCGPSDNMTITCDFEATLYLKLVLTRTQGETTTESDYACAVEPLRGRLNIAAITEELMSVVKFDGWPEVSLQLEGLRNNSKGLDEEQLQEVITELLTSGLRNVVIDLNFKSNKTFPRFKRARVVPDPVIPVGYDSMVTAQQTSEGTQPEGIQGLNGKRLLVKIVKATGIGCDTEVGESYAVVEMDEPPQKFTTSVIKDTNSPFWDEQFLFDMSDGTLELLFEIYDKKDNRFFGLGIVGIEELVATPSQRQIIPLQARPYENDPVSGSLTVEFLFLDRAELPDLTLRSSATTQSLSAKGDLITTTTTTYTKSPETQEVVVNGGDSVAAAALRDIEERKAMIANTNASKSTMIIHASRKPEDGLETTDDVTAPLISTATDPATTTITTLTDNQAPTTTTTTDVSTDLADPSLEPADSSERGRSRSSRRKRDSFFGTLKKRFSRSKVRSKSVDPNARDVSLDGDASVGRSVSMERSTSVARSSGLLSVPRTTGGDGGSTRSSISEAESGVSGSSTRTYVNEASTLIVEAEENGIIKHYLIPLSLQQRSKWRKKGIKLHVYNEHIFVAKHMSSSTPCQVCQKTLGRRFGKQGYECRDCGFKCHKPCHVKTDTICPNSTINSMDLEIVKDHREERKSWLRKAKTS